MKKNCSSHETRPLGCPSAACVSDQELSSRILKSSAVFAWDPASQVCSLPIAEQGRTLRRRQGSLMPNFGLNTL